MNRLLYFVTGFFWCTNKPGHPLFCLSVPNQRGRLCFPHRTWQSLVWTSKLPCVRGSHLGHRLPFIVINSDLLCCHEMSLLFSVLGFVNSTDVYPHLFEVFLVKASVRAKFCSPLAAQSKEAGLQSWSHRLWFRWNRVCKRHGLRFEFALIRLFPPPKPSSNTWSMAGGNTWNEISALLKQVRVHTNEQYPRTLKQI